MKIKLLYLYCPIIRQGGDFRGRSSRHSGNIHLPSFFSNGMLNWGVGIMLWPVWEQDRLELKFTFLVILLWQLNDMEFSIWTVISTTWRHSMFTLISLCLHVLKKESSLCWDLLWDIICPPKCLNIYIVILCPSKYMYCIIILTFIRTDLCFNRELTMHLAFLSVIEYKRQKGMVTISLLRSRSGRSHATFPVPGPSSCEGN